MVQSKCSHIFYRHAKNHQRVIGRNCHSCECYVAHTFIAHSVCPFVSPSFILTRLPTGCGDARGKQRQRWYSMAVQ